MFRRILVAVDGTPRSAASIALARQLAQQTRGRLELLRVEPVGASEAAIAADQRSLTQLATQLRAQGLDAHALLEYDEPGAGSAGAPAAGIIAATARAQHSEVIVVAPRQRGVLQTLRHPSVTARLFASAPAPLFILPAHPDPDTEAEAPAPDQPHHDASHASHAGHAQAPAGAAPLGATAGAFLRSTCAVVLVPLDGSALAEEALPLAVALARAYDRTLLLVRVVAPIVLAGGGPETLRLQREAQADAEREALHYLRRLRRQLASMPPDALERGASELSVQTMLRTGDATEELLRLAESRPDSVLVMSTHGRGAVLRVLAGSVATALMQRTPIPMLVVPPHAFSPAAR